MDKTPWNPSRSATKRVKNPLPAPSQCNCCGREGVEIKHHDDIYGRSYGDWPWAYYCSGCDSYVGMHPFTSIPLGTLADSETRKARNYCKRPFEAIHRSGMISRSEAYSMLADRLSIPKEQCHFAWFDIATCRKAAEAACQIREELAR